MNEAGKNKPYPSRSGFQPNMSLPETARRAAPPLHPEWMKILGYTNLDFAPQTITFDQWQHPNWTIADATDGTPLVTLSAKSVTITKSQVIATGEIVLVYYFQAHVKTEGWSVNQPGTIPSHSGAITIDFRNSQGGTVWGDTIYLNFNCGVDNQQFQSKRIPIDVFDLIQGVHLGPTAQDYWHC